MKPSPSMGAVQAAWLLGLASLGLSFLVTWHERPWASFHTEVVAGIGLLLVLASLLVQRVRSRWPAIALGVLALALVPWLQWWGGLLPFQADAWLATLYLGLFAMSIAAGAQLLLQRGPRGLTALFAVIVAAALASAVIAVAQDFRIRMPLPSWAVLPRPEGSRPYANLAQPNLLASLLMLGVVGLIWFRQVGRAHGGWLVCAAALLGMGLVATESRTPAVQLAVLAAVVMLDGRAAGLAVRARAVLAFLAWLVAWYGLRTWLLAGQGLPAPRTMVDAGPSPRLSHWLTHVEALELQPWTGYGWGQTSAAQASGLGDSPGIGEVTSYTHNIVLDLLVWNGWPLGALIVVAMASWLAWACIRNREPVCLVSLAGVLVLGVHACLEYPHAYLNFLGVGGLLLGVAWQALVQSPSEHRPAARVPGAAILLFLTGLGTAVVHDYLAIGAHDVQGRPALQATPRAAEVYLLDHLAAAQYWASQASRAEATPAHLKDLSRISRRMPGYPSLLHRARMEFALGETERARRTLVYTCAVGIGCAEFITDWLRLWPPGQEEDRALDTACQALQKMRQGSESPAHASLVRRCGARVRP